MCRDTLTNIPDESNPIPIADKSPIPRKLKENKVTDEDVFKIESTSKEFLSTIKEMKDSFLTRVENTKQPNDEDVVTKFCDSLKIRMRELSEDKREEAEIDILQVIRRIRKNERDQL